MHLYKRGFPWLKGGGFHSEILTSGSWYQGNEEGLAGLLKRGSFSLRVSIDAEHQAAVPLSRVIELIRAADGLGIEVNFTLREIPGEERIHGARHSLAEIKRELPVFYSQNEKRSRWLHWLPHMPILGSGSGTGGGKLCQGCSFVYRDLVIGEDGRVYPCCGLFGMPGYERFSSGDPLQETWAEIIGGQEQDSLFCVIREKGPYQMVRTIGRGLKEGGIEYYGGICQLCRELLSQVGGGG